MNNDQQAPKEVSVNCHIDMQHMCVVVTPVAINGISVVNPVQAPIAFNTWLGVAARLILAMEQAAQQAQGAGLVVVPGGQSEH